MATQSGPLHQVHFIKPWNQKFQNFDMFFDSFSNTLVFHNEGYFMIWDEHIKDQDKGQVPFTLNLSTIYKKLFGCAIHPSKSCIALQNSENTLNMLFLRQKNAEEISLNFSKAKQILGFSFLFGDDFNFFVCTNLSIEIYDIKIQKQKIRSVKSITHQIQEPQLFMEPLANVLVISDNKGTCNPFFLNLYKSKQHRGKPFQLDTDNVPAQNLAQPELAMQQNQGPNVSQAQRPSFKDRAMSLFKQPTNKYILMSQQGNKNLKSISTLLNGNHPSDLERDHNYRRQAHQILISCYYNKVIMMHLNPFKGEVFLYELDPQVSYRYNNSIKVEIQQRIQLQTIDNLIVVHNLDQMHSQLYDLKVSEYNKPLLDQFSHVESKLAKNLIFFSDRVFEEEMRKNQQGFSNTLDEMQTMESQILQKFGKVLTTGKYENQQKQEQVINVVERNEDNKEKVDMDLKVEYTGDENKPVKAGITIADQVVANGQGDTDYEQLCYGDSLVFLDPMFVLDVKNFTLTTMKVSLQKFINNSAGTCKTILSLMNRQNNKKVLIENVWHAIINQKLTLVEISKFFMKFNSVYKQASVERNSIKKKAALSSPLPQLDKENLLNQEDLIVQHLRLGRVKANTSFNSISFNNILIEFSSNSRVLSGETIVFQNELLDTFKDLINLSEFPLEEKFTLPSWAIKPSQQPNKRYITSILLEFLRCLLENQLPQQPSHQALMMKWIVRTQDYAQLHSLLQYHVLTDSLELARELMRLGSQEASYTSLYTNEKVYSPAYQYGLDMLQKLKSYEDIVSALVSKNLTLKALDYALENNVHSMRLSNFLQQVQKLKESGQEAKANQILKRITEIKRFDEVKSKNNPNYKPIFIDV